MKKTLILAGILALALSSQCYAANSSVPTKASVPRSKCCEKQPPLSMQRPPKEPDFKKAEFEKRLKLTDAQKAKAKAIREKGHEQMKPIMEQIRIKHEEIRTVRMATNLKAEEKTVKIDKLRGELRELNKKAHELRMQNMKEFEAILTKKQLKELQKMKEEGRKNFDKNFKKQHGNDLKPPFPPPFRHNPDGGDFPPPPPPEK